MIRVQPFFIVLLFLLPLLGACDTIVEPGEPFQPEIQVVLQLDEETIPASIRAAYQADAVQLAFRLLREQGADDISLPGDTVIALYDALLRVYAAETISIRDSIVGIHTFPFYSPTEVYVTVDTTVAWTHAWRERRSVTGQPTVDALVERYRLSVEYNVSQYRQYGLLRAAEPINTVALSSQFEDIEGVIHANPEGTIGDGNDIEARKVGDGWELAYSIGSGDCPSGCAQRRYWVYSVATDGTVIYQGRREKE